MKIIRLPDVKDLTGLSRSTIYLRMAEKSFPSSINLGARAVGWIESEIEEWVELRISLSRNSQSK
jgi:prophage regulatory protein